jgi:hypothetical protein
LSVCFGTVNAQTDCDAYSKKYIPKTLDDALTYLACTWTKNDKDSFRIKPEQEAVTTLHFGVGLSIRNGWNLWKGKNALVKYFKSVGIFHPDDMSSIILISFHRHLNGNDIKLDEQVKPYQDYWKKARNARLTKENEQKKQAKNEFSTFSVGDTVKIEYKLHLNSGAVFAYAVQKYPALDEKANCFVTGIVKKKKVKRNKYHLLKIMVIDLCGYKEAYEGKERILPGQEHLFNISSYKIHQN